MSKIHRIGSLVSILGLSKTTIYKMMNEGLFPKSIQLTERSVGWLESDINDWINSRQKVEEV